jgi:prepilin-type N-terminal cleavage/methylation domain-containing protein
MRSALIGTPAASSSLRCDRGDKRAGFTLIEALVAMALVLAFVATLGPYLFHARRIMDNGERRMEAQILLRTLLNAPFDRSQLANAVRSGEFNELHWRIVATPMAIDETPSNNQTWSAYRVAASVSFGAGQIVTAETVELAKSQRP